MIPRRFYWIIDLLVLIISLLLVTPVASGLRNIIMLTKLWSGEVGRLAESGYTPLGGHLWILLVAALPIIVSLDLAGEEKWLFQSRSKIIFAASASALLGVSLITLVLFILKNALVQFPRLQLFSFGIMSACGLATYRLIIQQYYKRRKAGGHHVQNMLIVGTPNAIAWITQYFVENVNANDYRIIGSLRVGNGNGIDESGNAPREQCSERKNTQPILGSVDQLGVLLINKQIDEVLAVQPANDGTWITQIIHDCDNMGILLRIVPESLIFDQTKRLHSLYANQTLHLPNVVLSPPHFDSDALFIKRVLDIAIASLCLLLLSPLFALIALLIKITTPKLDVFYPWHVVGRNGMRFTGYKFATMVADADQQKEKLEKMNEMSGPVFKIKDDPRITPVGKFLRKFDLNELPQLWSVLKGDMSLVGPRPAGPHELERYEFWHKRRLSIRPGITCLWQVRGRNRISNFDDWVKMDLEYIDNWSLWLDFKILVRTAFVVLRGTGS